MRHSEKPPASWVTIIYFSILAAILWFTLVNGIISGINFPPKKSELKEVSGHFLARQKFAAVSAAPYLFLDKNGVLIRFDCEEFPPINKCLESKFDNIYKIGDVSVLYYVSNLDAHQNRVFLSIEKNGLELVSYISRASSNINTSITKDKYGIPKRISVNVTVFMSAFLFFIVSCITIMLVVGTFKKTRATSK